MIESAQVESPVAECALSRCRNARQTASLD